MVAVIYARYSDSKQTEQSIEGQLKVCYKYCEANGYTVLQEYIDRAQSGKTDNRTQFRKMLADSKKKQFETVVVYAIDRFGRNVLQSLLNEKSLQDNGVTLCSATEDFQNTPAGRMQRNIHMSFAQYYSEELAQKVTRGMEINAEKGRPKFFSILTATTSSTSPPPWMYALTGCGSRSTAPTVRLP